MLQPILHEHKEQIQQYSAMFSDKLQEAGSDLKAQATDPSNLMKAAGMAA